MKSEQKMLFLYFFFNTNFRAAIELFMRIMLSNPTVIVMSQYPSNISSIIQLFVCTCTCNEEVDALEPSFRVVEMLLQRCTVQQAIAKGRKDGAAKRRPPRTKFLDNNASRESKRDPNIWHRAEKLNYQ